MPYFFRDGDGNKILLRKGQTIASLDGKRQASADTLVNPSWAARDRAKYGVFWEDPPAPKPRPAQEPDPQLETAEKALEKWASGLGVTLEAIARVLSKPRRRQ